MEKLINIIQKYPELMDDIRFSKVMRFFTHHPKAFDIIIANKHNTLSQLSSTLYENGISNKDKPYSLGTLSGLLKYVKRVDNLISRDNPMLISTSTSFNPLVSSSIKSANTSFPTNPVRHYSTMVSKYLSKSYGYVNDTNFVQNLKEGLRAHLLELNDNQVYKFSFKLSWRSGVNNTVNTIEVGKSYFIDKSVSADILFESVFEKVNVRMESYNLVNTNLYLICFYKLWDLPAEFKSKIKKNSTLTEAIKRDIPDFSFKSVLNRLDKLDNQNKYKDVLISNYGTLLNTFNFENSTYSLYELKAEKIWVEKIDSKIYNIYSVDGPEFSKEKCILKWCDRKTDNGFIREYNNIHYIYVKDNKETKYKYFEFKYNCKSPSEISLPQEFNARIGSMDFETYEDKNNFIVYAGGFATSKSIYKQYITDKAGDFDFDLLFDNIFHQELEGYTFFCHNLGKFDGLLILQGLSFSKKYKLKVFCKNEGTTILYINISERKTNKTIKIIDSLQLMNNSLKDLLVHFNCDTQKGDFPYGFVTKQKLFYKGPKPDIKDYPNMTHEAYNKIPSHNWDIVEETLTYLEKDLKGLLEICVKFSTFIYDNFSLNVTDFYTLPSLSMAIFKTKFIDKKQLESIKLLPPVVENDIRNSYYGGHSINYQSSFKGGFKYDMNSQYPMAMLGPMPVGNPILTSDTNLNNYYGFVLAEIVPPKDKLLIIQYRKVGRIEYPAETFTRWIYTEELKKAVDYGYTCKVICGYKFEKSTSLFTKYVNFFFDLKANAKNPTERQIAKFFLNTLYGKFGVNIPLAEVKLLEKRKVKHLDKFNDIEYLGEIGNYMLIKNYGSIESILNINESNYFTSNDLYNGIRNKGSVHIASAISAEARVLMYPYLLNKNNPVVLINTDGIIVPNQLEPNLVGKEIGKMKLEETLESGIIIYPKFYYLKTVDNKEIIKSVGINSNLLTQQEFVKLLNGEAITLTVKKFKLELKTANIKYLPSQITIKK